MTFRIFYMILRWASTREEYDAIGSSVRNHAKAMGYTDDRDGLFAFFIDKLRRNLHFVLCHSPVAWALVSELGEIRFGV